METNILLQGL